MSALLCSTSAPTFLPQVALVYASRASKLILMDRDSAALERASARCLAEGGSGVEALCLTVDVTDFEAVKAATARGLERFGRLNVLVLCAGLGGHHLFEATQDLAIFRRLMEVNFFGYLHCVRAAYKALCESRGSLIAVTSFSGEVGLPYRTAYCASKFAVTGFLESLRAEMSVASPTHCFDITIVCPPTVDTNLRANSLSAGMSSTALPHEKAPGEGAMTVADCAAAIVDAGDRRLRKAFFPITSWIASYLRPLIPDAMDKLIMKRAKL